MVSDTVGDSFVQFSISMNLIISGTNRPNSYSLKTAQYYQKQLQAKGINMDIFSLCDLPPDIIDSDLYGKRSAVFEEIQKRFSNAKKFIFIIPEYNGSLPGILKCFIDACSFPETFYNKKAALVGVSTGRHGNLRGLDHFTGIANHFNLHIMPFKIHLAAIHQELDKENNLLNENTINFVDDHMKKFIEF
ncbi:MAG: NADPH-dependent reductase [Mucilaginibacter sp.]|nr:NADPH-dependent reductase [Mucilaginibacter sp.]